MIDAWLGVRAPDPDPWTSACRFEAALATATAELGRLDAVDAAAIARACDDVAAAGWHGLDLATAGSPVIPLVDAVRDRLRRDGHPAAAEAVHRGATSQDVVDSALMVVAAGSAAALGAALTRAADAADALARRHAATPMSARTLLQRARPTTFGHLATAWLDGLVTARERVAHVRRPVQLGGPTGDLDDPALVAAVAHHLGLDVPRRPWHADRGPVTELASAFGGAAVAVAKPALDVVLLSQTELGEVREASPGGSSSMPHKRNPIAAVRARAAAAEAPTLVAAVLGAAVPELQRGAGTWQAEWAPLLRLLATTVAAAESLATSLGGLDVDVAATARNLDEEHR